MSFPIIENISQQYKNQPESSHAIAVVDYLINEMLSEMKDHKSQQLRIMWIESIEEIFNYAISRFSKDKTTYTEGQRKDFFRRKWLVKEKIRELGIKHGRMLLNELEVVS